ncbi:MAG: ribonuclease H-like domain-containing protein [Candidatus Aenigmarchaeota archaeon]|nr:ribonuclease H-like domain-containing protein [Candidatus Aenigmarchaeota archaeon]
MELLVYDLDYFLRDEKPVARIFCIDKNGKKYEVLYERLTPYFYILPVKRRENEIIKKLKNIRNLPTKILGIVKVEKILGTERRTFLKVKVENPRKIMKVREIVKEWEDVEETYEYSFSFSKRFLIDSGIVPLKWIKVDGKISGKSVEANEIKILEKDEMPKFRILAFDTEWVEDKGKNKLIMVSIVSNSGMKCVITTEDWKDKPSYVITVPNERGIIKKFVEIVENFDPHFLVGYNSDGFDFSHLKKKAKECKIELKFGNETLKFVRRGRVSAAKIPGIVHIDLYIFVGHILSPILKSEVLTLDEVARELIGEGKKEIDYRTLVEIWSKKKGLERLVEYNLHDSVLTLKLAEVLLPQIFEISSLVREVPFDTSRYTYSQLVESFYIKKAFEDERIIPNPPKTEEKERRMEELPYKGAIVIEPKEGIHSNILVFDFRSLYPTIIVTHNISPETLNCGHEDCKKNNKVPDLPYHFCKRMKGFIPKHLSSLINLRKEIKKTMKRIKEDSIKYKILENRQYALKIISNATYGYFGYIGARWYKRECGASTASFGRYYIKKVIEEAKKKGFNIIYGDTDSLMIALPGKKLEELEKIGREFAEEVNKKLPGIIELEFRSIYLTGIFVKRERGKGGAKKRYALLDKDGKIEIRGFETVRRDWCKLAKDLQRKVLEIVLKERKAETAVKLVRDVISKIKRGEVDLEDLVIYEQITRPLSEYEQLGPHVRAAMKAKKRGIPIGEGAIIAYVITKGSGSISERAEPVDFVKKDDYDPEYYIKHQILPASLRVLKALGYTELQILSGSKQRGLSEFVK